MLSDGGTHGSVTVPELGEVPCWVSGANVIVDPVLLLPEHPPRTNAMTNKVVNLSRVAVSPNFCMLCHPCNFYSLQCSSENRHRQYVCKWGRSGIAVKMRRVSQICEAHLVNATRVMLEFVFCPTGDVRT